MFFVSMFEHPKTWPFFGLKQRPCSDLPWKGTWIWKRPFCPPLPHVPPLPLPNPKGSFGPANDDQACRGVNLAMATFRFIVSCLWQSKAKHLSIVKEQSKRWRPSALLYCKWLAMGRGGYMERRYGTCSSVSLMASGVKELKQGCEWIECTMYCVLLVKFVLSMLSALLFF